jgi:pimeloyl-ACP methyl ester carboxylesterase
MAEGRPAERSSEGWPKAARRAEFRTMAIRRETGFLEHDGERIYWESLGTGPPLVLCHGLGGNHAVWFQQVAFFARERRVVVWDQRGFGRSTDRGARSGPEAAVADLAALLDHLGLERVDLVGQSMGGWAALGLALESPARVRSLVLADSLGGIHAAEIANAYAEAREAKGAPPLAAVPLLGHHVAIDAALLARDPGRAWLYQALGGMGEPDVAAVTPRLLGTRRDPEAVGALPCPLLCVVGEKDPLFPPSVVRAAAGLLPGARVVEIPASGHSPYFEEPEAWNAAVAAFLAAAGD